MSVYGGMLWSTVTVKDVHVDVLVVGVLGGGTGGLIVARSGENLMGDHWWRPDFSWT